MKITVFTKDNCIQCKMTKRFLEEHNVDFVEKNTNDNPEYVSYLKEQGFKAMPVVESKAIDAFSGFQPQQLQKLVG